MSQLDFVHFFPTLVWAIVCFMLFYFVFNILFLSTFYKNMRIRYWFEKRIKLVILEKWNSVGLLNLNEFFYFSIVDSSNI